MGSFLDLAFARGLGCRQCGQPVPQHPHAGRPALLCSDKCRRADSAARYASRAGAHQTRKPRLVAHDYPRLPKELACKECGSEFLYGGSSRKPPAFCSDECRNLQKKLANKKWRIEHAIEIKLQNKNRKRPTVSFKNHICQVCTKSFKARQHNAKCCSKKCVAEFLRLKAIAASAHLVIWLNCQGCGERFRPTKGNSEQRRSGYVQKFCSWECRLGRPQDRRRRLDVGQKQRRGKNSAIDPFKVFERDGWRCHLCGRKTPKALRGTTNDRAPERDHIISIFDGGSDTYENSACACRRCNRKKGRKSRGQLLLFG